MSKSKSSVQPAFSSLHPFITFLYLIPGPQSEDHCHLGKSLPIPGGGSVPPGHPFSYPILFCHGTGCDFWFTLFKTIICLLFFFFFPTEPGLPCGAWAFRHGGQDLVAQGLWDPTSPTGMEPTFPALKRRFLIIGPPGKSLWYTFIATVIWLHL